MLKGSVGFQGCLDLGDGVLGFSRLFLAPQASWNMGTLQQLQGRVISGSFTTINELPNLSAQWRFDFAVIFEAERKVKEQLKENREICVWLSYRVIGAQSRTPAAGMPVALRAQKGGDRKGDGVSKNSMSVLREHREL